MANSPNLLNWYTFKAILTAHTHTHTHVWTYRIGLQFAQNVCILCVYIVSFVIWAVARKLFFHIIKHMENEQQDSNQQDSNQQDSNFDEVNDFMDLRTHLFLSQFQVLRIVTISSMNLFVFWMKWNKWERERAVRQIANGYVRTNNTITSTHNTHICIEFKRFT